MLRLLLLLFVIFIVAGVIGLLPALITLVPHGLFGWLGFLIRVIPEIRWNPLAVATALACLAGLAVGAHAFLDWLFRSWHAGPEAPPPWRKGWTASLVVLVVLTFAAGIATVGAAHQLAWLGTSPEPWLKSDWSSARSRPHVGEYSREIKNLRDAGKPMPPAVLQRMVGEAAARDLRLVVLNDREGLPWFVAIGPHDPASPHWQRCEFMGWTGRQDDQHTGVQHFNGDQWAEVIADAEAGRPLTRYRR